MSEIMMSILYNLVIVAALTLMVYATVELGRRPMDARARVVWILMIALIPILGPIASSIVNRSIPKTA